MQYIISPCNVSVLKLRRYMIQRLLDSHLIKFYKENSQRFKTICGSKAENLWRQLLKLYWLALRLLRILKCVSCSITCHVALEKAGFPLPYISNSSSNRSIRISATSRGGAQPRRPQQPQAVFCCPRNRTWIQHSARSLPHLLILIHPSPGTPSSCPSQSQNPSVFLLLTSPESCTGPSITYCLAGLAVAWGALCNSLLCPLSSLGVTSMRYTT